MDMDPRILLLGICDAVALSTHKQLCVFYVAFYARKVLFVKVEAD